MKEDLILLKVKNIETYYGPILALRGISFEVKEGSIHTVLGPNGAGKSTILKTIMGLIDDQPDKGSIEFLGKNIGGRNTEEIVNMGIAYVPEGREIFPELSVNENLLMGTYPRRDTSGIKEDYRWVYSLFPVLKDRSRQWGGTLSGGEQQMLAIGRALMARPRLLLLDEPSLGLSPRLVSEIFNVIETINTKGTTVLLVEQNARMALKVANHGYIVETGRIVLEGSSPDLMENEDIREFYLGVRSEVADKGYQRWKRKKRWR